MILIAVAAVLACPLTVLILLRHLEGKDIEARNERQLLLNRIQAPDTAVAQVVAETIPDVPPYVGWDDDEAFQTARANGL